MWLHMVELILILAILLLPLVILTEAAGADAHHDVPAPLVIRFQGIDSGHTASGHPCHQIILRVMAQKRRISTKVSLTPDRAVSKLIDSMSEL